ALRAADALRALAERRGFTVRADEPLVKKTWWRVGGPADAYVEVADLDALRDLVALAAVHGIPLFPLGNASNLLVSDRGIRGIVVRLVGGLAGAEQRGATVELGGGLKLTSLLKRAERAGWTGLELFAGIPGTVGGAVRMNAGTAVGEVADRLIDVTVVESGPDAVVSVLPASALNLGYRHADLPTGAVVASARFALTDGDPAESKRKVEEHLAYRARTQPVDVPTCGSTFRNPPDDHAGRLIEACGLKGRRIGGAEVSTKHANFLVNTGDATAADLKALISLVQREVEAATGIRLVPEVHLAGDWGSEPA
ncbi:MAG: UDP-N-acetylmuramate dehydrogenase, partial [Myxococcota bacterium]